MADQQRRRALDAVVVVGLVAVAVVARRGSLPSDGLWYDDAWVVVGASKAQPSQLLTVSTNHPAFSAFLMGWARIVDHRSELMALPAFVVGSATPALAYLVLRARRVLPGVALLLAAVLAVDGAHVRYSGRVKSYVFEAVVVLGLAVVVPWLARRRWGWPVAIAWTVGALLVGTGSAFCLVAVGVAGVVLLAHPQGDVIPRAVAVAVQGVLQAAYFAVVQARFASARVADDWERVYNGYIELHANPFRVAGEVASHTGEVGKAFVGGPGWLGALVVVVAIAGLAWHARRGPHVVLARYLLALPLVALIGSFLQQIPYGAVENGVSPGSRAAIWLIPSLLVGTALFLDGLLRRFLDVERAGGAITGVALVAAAAVLVAGVGDTPDYPLHGARRAAAYVRTHLDRDSVAIVMPSGLYPLAAEPGVGVRIVADRHSELGFAPALRDRRIHLFRVAQAPVATETVRSYTDGAKRVLVHDGLVGAFDPVNRVAAGLRAVGYRKVRTVVFDQAAVFVWARP
jgi:hypothetical protein